MHPLRLLVLTAAAAIVLFPSLLRAQAVAVAVDAATLASDSVVPAAAGPLSAQDRAGLRRADDLAAMQQFRPSYPFWRHVFTVPDGAIVFGSATDGRLLATIRGDGDWARAAVWTDPGLAPVLYGQVLPRRVSDRRDEVARLLEAVAGPIVHNPTRGLFVQPNVTRYGAFISEWGAIYERFGVPAEIGLAQALVESGFNGRVRSEARAIGFCQWLDRNWKRLATLAPRPIEAQNQTTQAAYCAAYLTILATKYGSFIPALSEHHAGGTNIGRTLINGERLGGADVRERYFLGSAFARDLRTLSPGTFSDVYGTYGPRSFRYAEMIFGNAVNVADIEARVPQKEIFAMRAAQPLSLAVITRATGLSADEVKRYNPALVRQVPKGATLYLPKYVKALGADVTYWHRAPSRAYEDALDDFVNLDVPPGTWDSPQFDAVLRDFRRRFTATGTEEGGVMATMLAYVMEDRQSSRQAAILAEFRESPAVLDLFEQARHELELHGLPLAPAASDVAEASFVEP